jgi:hypothetical protein
MVSHTFITKYDGSLHSITPKYEHVNNPKMKGLLLPLFSSYLVMDNLWKHNMLHRNPVKKRQEVVHRVFCCENMKTHETCSVASLEVSIRTNNCTSHSSTSIYFSSSTHPNTPLKTELLQRQYPLPKSFRTKF